MAAVGIMGRRHFGVLLTQSDTPVGRRILTFANFIARSETLLCCLEGIALERPALLTVPQVAKQLGIAEKTCWAWIYARRLPVTRLGRCVRIPSDALDQMIEEATIPALKGR